MAKEDNIGALWIKRKENGDEFYSGVLDNGDGTKKKIIIFRNGFKNKDTQPDFMILRAKERQDGFEFNETDENYDDLPF